MALSKVWAVVAQEIENQLTNLKLVGFNGFLFGSVALMNPLMILVKIIKLRWIHILSYDQMV
ncbi:hypothetical protein CI630_04800, partial [Enterobacter hormaechei subsp. steigerwaltii]|uniref:hypothetical protein n=1 Tax=Enterobacter hormaechei TaxID=158836 RepID=UPI000B9F6A40